MATVIPQYPFWEADRPTQVFGAPHDRFLDVSKEEARAICRAIPDEAAAATELFVTGAIVNKTLNRGLDPALTAEGVRATIGALLASFAVSHEIKEATVAVALHRWFDQVPA